MIAVDTSILVAIAFEEGGSSAFLDVISDEEFAVGWPTAFETAMVIFGKKGRSAEEFIHEILAFETARPEPFRMEHFIWAERAFYKYGKGQGHAARLNYGDCMAYAIARELGAPLLFKGGDFAKTDVKVHAASAAA